MKLEIGDIFTLDFDDPHGLPPNEDSFSVFVECHIYEPGGHTEAFEFTVCSRDQLCPNDSGFIEQSLVLKRFSWKEVREKVQALVDRVAERDWENQYCEIARAMYPRDLFSLVSPVKPPTTGQP